jgi:hypothetical protein
MRARLLLALSVAALPGCPGGTPNPVGYEGYSMEDFFPFDGQRSWTFVNADASVPNRVVVTLDPAYEEASSGALVYTISYGIECPSDSEDDSGLEEPDACAEGPWRVRSVKWSSDSTLGTLIHAIDTESTGEVAFDPAIQVTDDRGQLDALETTETGGATWYSRFTEVTDCPVLFTDEWDQCVNIHLDDDNDATTPGTHPIHGDYYAVAGWNVVAFQLTNDSDRWELLSTTYEEIE